jgi:hypothetical protein
MVPKMDEEDSQVPIWSYRVNLDKRVRDDHPLWRIRAALDLSFVRKEVAGTYGRQGNKSVPPEVIIGCASIRAQASGRTRLGIFVVTSVAKVGL